MFFKEKGRGTKGLQGVTRAKERMGPDCPEEIEAKERKKKERPLKLS